MLGAGAYIINEGFDIKWAILVLIVGGLWLILLHRDKLQLANLSDRLLGWGVKNSMFAFLIVVLGGGLLGATLFGGSWLWMIHEYKKNPPPLPPPPQLTRVEPTTIPPSIAPGVSSGAASDSPMSLVVQLRSYVFRTRQHQDVPSQIVGVPVIVGVSCYPIGFIDAKAVSVAIDDYETGPLKVNTSLGVLGRIDRASGLTVMFEIPENTASGQKQLVFTVVDSHGRTWKSDTGQIDFGLRQLPDMTFMFGEEASVILPGPEFVDIQPTKGFGTGVELQRGQVSRLIKLGDYESAKAVGVVITPNHIRGVLVDKFHVRIDRDSGHATERINVQTLVWQ